MIRYSPGICQPPVAQCQAFQFHSVLCFVWLPNKAGNKAIMTVFVRKSCRCCRYEWEGKVEEDGESLMVSYCTQ